MAMLAGRAPPGIAGCRRLLEAALAAGLRPLLCGLSPCWWVTARRAAGQWPSPGLRVPEAAETERLVQELHRPGASLRRFIACPQLARTVQRCLRSGAGPGAQCVVLECAPGPGILTRTLLNAGVRVVALESNSAFLPNLQSLENSLDGQLKVIYGDFFRLDPLVTGTVKPPAVCSDKLFEAMGVAAVPWRADLPVKVFGILPQKKERNVLWRLLFALYECNSIYRYGRVELNVFVSEKEYKVLTAKPGDVRAYQALTVLWQVGCEIELLHSEPWSSFITNLKNGALAVPKTMWLPNDHLCLIRLTPQQNLFTGSLKPTNSSNFIFMVKQCFAKPRSRVMDKFNSWSLDNAGKLLRELEIPENAESRSLYPEDYKRLFEALQNSSMFTETWFHDEAFESIRNINL
ncbi:dimethyladenosine transferase 2, mitochondrial isoform X2 [Falco biarmicus]|uniref:dimethyladenosine transferase 2, mitochondrial n=1 Tax=Falco rusticolus TaxID=120794 RepID=UPI00188671AE|nr:dimethyladenosine transferase 2, mitochondrial isoform X2 [Falco peregrinus]XP_037249097.1 dimethyladenosine transferase 2, mitochondrial [Falco rusticolus]XP_056198460.1 dimethyladenosine transferase 2, mitochondrial isoform X2 [Falco biarmicus]